MIVIDSQSRQPIYEQIVERVESLIAADVMKSGDQLPSVRALAVELSINPNTIQKAYAILEEHGAIYPVKGKGNFVSEKDKVTDRMKGQCFWRLKETVEQAKNLGIDEEEFSIKVRTYYREGKDD
ncbi:MAG: GntR family transcriptional regulator [Lachnospiraceae bacterium]|nr:GntR family transcriptional regulator [Lachnospiraceae bacterium]